METCKNCEHYKVCLIYCSESVLINRGICEHFKNGWISVKSGLPGYGERILACGHRGGIFCCKYLSYSERKGGFGKMDQASVHRHFTNWMPLPELPKTDGGKD